MLKIKAMKIKPYLLSLVLLAACSPESERQGNTSPDTTNQVQPIQRENPGTAADSARTNANPLYEGDNRDTL